MQNLKQFKQGTGEIIMRKTVLPKYHIKKSAFLKFLKLTYDAINQEAFNGKLPKISIQIYKLDDKTDYQTAASFCVRKETQTFRIENKRHSYGVEYLSIIFDSRLMYFTDSGKFTDDTIDYLFHEMIHEWCYLNGIDDCNTKTQYHNSYFMEAAENHELLCWTYDEKYGFNHTIIPNDLFNRIINCIPKEIWGLMRENIVVLNKIATHTNIE